MATDRRRRLEAWIQDAATIIPEQQLLTTTIDELQSWMWSELAELEELFDELDSLELALQRHLEALERAAPP